MAKRRAPIILNNLEDLPDIIEQLEEDDKKNSNINLIYFDSDNPQDSEPIAQPKQVKTVPSNPKLPTINDLDVTIGVTAENITNKNKDIIGIKVLIANPNYPTFSAQMYITLPYYYGQKETHIPIFSTVKIRISHVYDLDNPNWMYNTRYQIAELIDILEQKDYSHIYNELMPMVHNITENNQIYSKLHLSEIIIGVMEHATIEQFLSASNLEIVGFITEPLYVLVKVRDAK